MPTTDPNDPERLRAQIRRLEEGIADLKARLGYAQQDIQSLRDELAPYKPALRIGITGVNTPPKP